MIFNNKELEFLLQEVLTNVFTEKIQSKDKEVAKGVVLKLKEEYDQRGSLMVASRNKHQTKLF